MDGNELLEFDVKVEGSPLKATSEDSATIVTCCISHLRWEKYIIYILPLLDSFIYPA
jgi:hypothetical protein